VGGSGEVHLNEGGFLGELRLVEPGIAGKPRHDETGDPQELRLWNQASPLNCAMEEMGIISKPRVRNQCPQ